MTTEMPEKDRDATASVIHCIESNKHIDRLVHDMVHTCETVDEYLVKLDGLLRIFWGDTTPEKKKLDEVIWLEVMVQILPTECMLPVFKQSMLRVEGKENGNEEPEESSGR